MTLLLFDIDGTLVDAHGLGRRTIERSLAEVLGRPVPADGVPFAGRTDPAIAADMLRAAGVDEHDLPQMLARGLRHYVELMVSESTDAEVTALPGARALLERLARLDGVVLGLLTGNMETSAFAKLRAVRLDGFFRFGAFGSDHADRYVLPHVALDRARSELGLSLAASAAVVIGDTTHDVGCGRQAGMRTVAVSTGPVAAEDLEAAGPDLLLSTLEDADRFIRFLNV